MSLPHYASYKDSGVEWLGQAPEHWEGPRKLGAISSLKRRLGWQGLKADEYRIDGPYVVSSAHFSEYQVQWDECPRVSQQRYDTDTNIQLATGDVLLMKDGSIGKLAFIDKLPGNACLNSHLLLFRPLIVDEGPTYYSRFAFYFFQTALFQEHIKVNATGATFLGISQAAIARYQVVWPCLREQKTIATFLDRETAKIDALVAEQVKLIAQLKEKRQALISHAVTKGLNPDAPVKDSGIGWLGDVPSHWEVSRLKFVARIQCGIAKGKDTSGVETTRVPYLRVANVQDGYLDLSEVAEINVSVHEVERYKLQQGDVLMNEGGDFDKLGRGAIWHGEVENCIHQNHVFAVRPHALGPEWLNLVIGSDYAQFYFMGRSKQSTNLASISSTNLMELPVVLPPTAEQMAILTFIAIQSSRLEALTAEAHRAIDLLKERRSTLISAAVTGKIDVRGAATNPHQEVNP